MTTKKIKILYTIPNFDTAGSGKVVYDLVKHLDKERFEPHVACFHKNGVFFKEVEKLGVRIHIFQFATPYRPFLTFPFRLLKVCFFFKKNKFDVIHSWHWSSDFSEPLAAKLAGIPFVYTKKAMGWGNKAWIWRSKISTKIIAINSDMISLFFSKIHKKVKEIPLGVDMDYFQPIENGLIISKELEFDKSDFVIVSVANLVPVKGVEILLNAVILINNPKIKVIIVGDKINEYGAFLEKEYRNNTTFFLGKKLDIRPYLSISDLFIITTKNEGRKEGLPIAPIEAMASEKIVIGSNVSGITDVLKGFPFCVFESDNVESLKNKIIDIMDMPLKDRLMIQSNMRTYVEHNFSMEKFILSHEQLYTQMIK